MLSDNEFESVPNRVRVGWWMFVLVLAVAAAFIAYSFVGLIVLGVFGYYATRPIYRRLARHIESPGLAAATTVVVVVVPILVVVSYTGFRIFQQVRRFVFSGDPAGFSSYLGLDALPAAQRETVTALLRHPAQQAGQVISQPGHFAGTLSTLVTEGTKVAGAVFGGFLLLTLALALGYFLLENDHHLAAGFEELVGGTDTTAYAYATAIDADLESVFFGNLLFVIAMSIIAGVVYGATNLLAPQGVHVPLILSLAVLTGFTSLIPIVVSKVVYLPVVAYLGFQALTAGGGGTLAFVVGVLVVYFLVLDILPQTFIQPYITGRQLDMVVLMFGYILGPTLFGWYGFFFLPIVFIVMLEAIRIVLPELIRGEPLTPTVSMGEGVGTNPSSARSEVAANDEPSTDDAAAED